MFVFFWVVVMVVIVVFVVMLFFFVYCDVDYFDSLWWEFEIVDEVLCGFCVVVGFVFVVLVVVFYSLLCLVKFCL